MHPAKKDQKQVQKLSPRQKSILKYAITGVALSALAAILIIYINLHKSENTKAGTEQEFASGIKPVELNVPEILLLPDSVSSLRGAIFKIAKPLVPVAPANH